ncbi:hypothetical protein RHSIM_RhsimUnG0058300 [Rhododendron simsii]|uniref:EF-hand domain-containing protein n=1 Tax=Rhododendron simsii TaxID=118357 RepID=A0A834FVJ9_RHOSS|nr:hypothetical protein RHSIM_RhsimUnG0058300 [Rhododendron simsii]
MEEMRGAAMAYYANMSNDQQQMVLGFYESLDTNGDGKVGVQEYLDFLEQKGYSKRHMPPNLFKLLDENNDGTLDFEECHRRVLCDGCQSYLWGLYFVCVDCYNVGTGATYELCCSCYRNKNFSHAHSSFLDNYALLWTNRSKVKTWEEQEETCNGKTSNGGVSKRVLVVRISGGIRLEHVLRKICDRWNNLCIGSFSLSYVLDESDCELDNEESFDNILYLYPTTDRIDAKVEISRGLNSEITEALPELEVNFVVELIVSTDLVWRSML